MTTCNAHVEIQTAELVDSDLTCLHQFYQSQQEHSKGALLPRTVDQLHTAAAHGLLVAAYDSLGPCGMVMLAPRRERLSDVFGQVAEIGAFTVSSHYQGNGVGCRLIDHVTGVAAQKGIATLFARIAEGNPARTVFEKQGFIHGRNTTRLDGTPVTELIKCLKGETENKVAQWGALTHRH